MIDLNALQREIDDLLGNETDESLTKWYAKNKKLPDYKNILGEGYFSNKGLVTINIEVKSSPANKKVSEKANVLISRLTQFAIAA